jgi:hypothetical protein
MIPAAIPYASLCAGDRDRPLRVALLRVGASGTSRVLGYHDTSLAALEAAAVCGGEAQPLLSRDQSREVGIVRVAAAPTNEKSGELRVQLVADLYHGRVFTSASANRAKAAADATEIAVVAVNGQAEAARSPTFAAAALSLLGTSLMPSDFFEKFEDFKVYKRTQQHLKHTIIESNDVEDADVDADIVDDEVIDGGDDEDIDGGDDEDIDGGDDEDIDGGDDEDIDGGDDEDTDDGNNAVSSDSEAYEALVPPSIAIASSNGSGNAKTLAPATVRSTEVMDARQDGIIAVGDAIATLQNKSHGFSAASAAALFELNASRGKKTWADRERDRPASDRAFGFSL